MWLLDDLPWDLCLWGPHPGPVHKHRPSVSPAPITPLSTDHRIPATLPVTLNALLWILGSLPSPTICLLLSQAFACVILPTQKALGLVSQYQLLALSRCLGWSVGRGCRGQSLSPWPILGPAWDEHRPAHSPTGHSFRINCDLPSFRRP